MERLNRAVTSIHRLVLVFSWPPDSIKELSNMKRLAKNVLPSLDTAQDNFVPASAVHCSCVRKPNPRRSPEPVKRNLQTNLTQKQQHLETQG
jgi:hypothetical protein